MKLSLFSRRKIPLLFLLGVGIPSLALGYLAFRGIRNELALLEQRTLNEHRAISDIVSDTIEYHITTAERALSLSVVDRGSDLAIESGNSLDSLKERQPLVEEVFYFEGLETIRLPAAKLLFHSDGSLPPASAPSWPRVAAEHLRSGQQREFQQKRYHAALTSYGRALEGVADSALKGDALVTIARVERKVGDLRAAIATCETLLAGYDQVRTTAGVPLGPIAHLEHGLLLLATGDSTGAMEAFVDLYERLVKGDWALERAHYDFFLGRSDELIGELEAEAAAGGSLESYRAAVSHLKAKERERRESTERLLVFAATAGDHLRARISSNLEGSAATEDRFALESGGQTYLVTLLNQTGDDDGIWGLLLDAGYLRENLVRKGLEDLIDPATTDWIVKGRDGRAILAGDDPPLGSLTVNATLDGNFPPWLIEFYQRPQNPYRRLFASSQSIYFYMFLFIASILIFGTILTVRAVAHELELARLKSDFVSTVSHEFKSPLTSIRQLAEMLQSGRVPSGERQQRYYDVLVEQSSRLSSLVTNILDLARIEEGRKEFQFEAVDLDELVREMAVMAQHRVGHEGYIVEAHVEETLPPVRADRDAIGQAISNLVDNAVQYSGDTKQINLHASVGEGHVAIAVEDFGVGIPEDEIDKVFDRFYRGGDALTRSVKGSGLGLTLVKEIVEAHGGTVQVESEVGQGSRFTITLPVMTERNEA
jgi:signal transduction histidine kinase